MELIFATFSAHYIGTGIQRKLYGISKNYYMPGNVKIQFLNVTVQSALSNRKCLGNYDCFN